MAASNNRGDMLCSLWYCLFSPRTYRCYS